MSVRNWLGYSRASPIANNRMTKSNHNNSSRQTDVALVVTSIAGPNEILTTLARGCQEHGYRFIVIGDVPSPKDFKLDGCEFFSLDEQYQTGLTLATLSPTRHYARKNLGYLLAHRAGAQVILETDDDNIPEESFWQSRERKQSAQVVSALRVGERLSLLLGSDAVAARFSARARSGRLAATGVAKDCLTSIVRFSRDW